MKFDGIVQIECPKMTRGEYAKRSGKEIHGDQSENGFNGRYTDDPDEIGFWVSASFVKDNHRWVNHVVKETDAKAS